MAEPEVYLEKLSAFARMLRLEGLPISPQETADAAKLLTGLGFAHSSWPLIKYLTAFLSPRKS